VSLSSRVFLSEVKQQVDLLLLFWGTKIKVAMQDASLLRVKGDGTADVTVVRNNKGI